MEEKSPKKTPTKTPDKNSRPMSPLSEPFSGGSHPSRIERDTDRKGPMWPEVIRSGGYYKYLHLRQEQVERAEQELLQKQMGSEMPLLL